MTDNQHLQPRALAPRKLEQAETLQSLNHWRTVVRNYFRKCQYYSYFLAHNVKWDNSANRGFTTAETTGLKRSPAALAADLEGFISTIGTYLPFDYVTEKLLQETTDLQSVWSMIYEIYDVELVTTNYLNYALMSRESGETYRNYYNRLVGFTRQHLPSTRVTAEGIVSPDDGEKLTVALLDSIAIHWLLSIDRRLINIVRTEFSTELKTKRLSEMIKPIATNIDDLLARYDKTDQVATISTREVQATGHAMTQDPPNAINTIVRRLNKLESRFDRNKRHFRQKKNYSNNKSGFCKHCHFINKQLGASLDTNHSAVTCKKKALSVNVVEAWDISSSDSENGQSSSTTGELNTHDYSSNVSSLQTDAVTKLRVPIHKSTQCIIHSVDPNGDISAHNPLSLISDDSSNCNNLLTPVDTENSPEINVTGTPQTDSHINSCLIAAISNSLQSSVFPWNSIHKSRSPKLKCKLNRIRLTTLIDSGAEINVMDKSLLKRANIGMAKSCEKAHAANRLPLEICGQTSHPVVIQCETNAGYKPIYLGIMLIVANLGVDILVGEPGKQQNNLICLPTEKVVVFANERQPCRASYAPDTTDYMLARAATDYTLQPGEQIEIKLLNNLTNSSHVAITPRPCHSSWIVPTVTKPADGHIYLTNSTSEPIQVPKASHLADIRGTQEFPVSTKPLPSHRSSTLDTFQYGPLAAMEHDTEKYLHLIQVDPDHTLSSNQRNKFIEINKEFAHLFNPQPGRYSGHYGHIDNKLKFSSLPPPNSKTHIPNYSPSMNDLLAQKMDQLEKWGVLAKPETIGVSVDFVSPSLLVPKPEPGEYRVVTDFSSLNTHLKRVPNTSATIIQAKSRIARASFVIHMDFSNYFFQNGLQKNDIRYLGTVHPYKGLRVYTCDPQGLKGASERCYEKLVRIFGDMVQSKRLAQMADGIHILGNTVDELTANYIEVLKRADSCNFTFKPAKVIICPKNITLFGWDLKGNTWHPTPHTISTLTNAPKPVTIKQLRSFLGSLKQLSNSLPGYAVIIHELEKTVGGQKSATRIAWTESLTKSFEDAKLLAANPIGVAEPRPGDCLHTYSDYSAENNAVGGRLVIIRKTGNKTEELVGGFFNAVLDKHKRAWLPCEGEAIGIRLVLEHYQHHIRESNNTTIHHTDSQPCVLAWKRSQRGAFSSSSRISSFLTGLSVLPVELRFKSGKTLFTSDYASRHPSKCQSSKCQICTFVQQWESIGDNATNIRTLTVDDIKTGKSIMPLTQRKIWTNIKKKDGIYKNLTELILSQQLPEQKKRKGDYTKLKLLHNLYAQGKLFINSDGLILIKSPEGRIDNSVISVPPSLFHGLMNALHIKLEHPSKAQLISLVQRYFYSPGWRSIIEEISSQCHQCSTLRQLPKTLIEDTTTTNHGIGAALAADVIERNTQKILIVKDKLSQFIRGTLIPDQTVNTLRQSLLSLIMDILPDSGTTIRVDGATSFQALEKESKSSGSLLNQLKISIQVGRIVNKNKNPVAENAVKEVLKEILRLKAANSTISQTDLDIVIRNINNRITFNGLSPKEIMFKRDMVSNEDILVKSKQISDLQLLNRKTSSERSQKSKTRFMKKTPHQDFQIGQLVLLRNSLSKNCPRDTYIIEDKVQETDCTYYLIRKVQTRLNQRLYKVLPDEIVLAPSQKPYPKQDSSNIDLVTSDEENTPNSGQQTKSVVTRRRSTRKAAIQASEKISALNRVSKQPRNPFKYGWRSEDQLSEVDDFIILDDPSYQDSDSSVGATNSQTSNSDESHSNHSFSSEDDLEDLQWDTVSTGT